MRSGGFTLVEILVVLAVIGITLALASGRLFVTDAERVRLESERLLALLEEVRDRAAFSGHAMALRLTDEGIEFLERDPHRMEASWRTPEGGAASASWRWREGVRVERLATARESQTMLAFVPSGIAAPFRLRVSLNDQARIVEADALGNLRLAE